MAIGYQINLTRGKITVDSITCKNKKLIYTTKSMLILLLMMFTWLELLTISNPDAEALIPETWTKLEGALWLNKCNVGYYNFVSFEILRM